MPTCRCDLSMHSLCVLLSKIRTEMSNDFVRLVICILICTLPLRDLIGFRGRVAEDTNRLAGSGG